MKEQVLARERRSSKLALTLSDWFYGGYPSRTKRSRAQSCSIFCSSLYFWLLQMNLFALVSLSRPSQPDLPCEDARRFALQPFPLTEAGPSQPPVAMPLSDAPSPYGCSLLSDNLPRPPFVLPPVAQLFFLACLDSSCQVCCALHSFQAEGLAGLASKHHEDNNTLAGLTGSRGRSLGCQALLW